MTDPKITVIIPTRERCDVLESSLRTATSQDYENLEIIVSDNCSGDDTPDVVRRAHDRRIRYLNTGKRLSMSHNWEFALSHVDEGWVTFMGDDDGLMPAALSSVADIIRATNAKAIRSSFCTYDWPMITGNKHGQLIVPRTTRLEVRETCRWLSRVMHGRARYSQLPMIYNGGFIHTSILKEIRAKTGSYFLSASPDVYSAIAISRSIDRYVYTGVPLAISGTSGHSNGHSFFSANKQRNEIPRTKFANEGNIPFHASVPLCVDGSYPLSLQVCAYEAYMQSESLGNPVPGINPAQQLEVIMATAGKHRTSIAKWGEAFAEMHQLDYGTAQRSAELKRYLLQSTAMIRKIFNAANSVITETLPISNIHEASIAAAVIRSSPGRMDSLRFLASRLASLSKQLTQSD
ncbi:hypothetical protein ASG87_07925 [Frateuria sp. Soil773]|uniref:glycosyltransferase family 2 protein n=1 Tax=Frateuria sp. Soil773 TaxID=1736407 RepID=UPI0006F37DF1|nr:glycosyltransferase [Frateuria sp. Soil773]KRE88512.1 hypothetical protein ASG87_07925 [Frateuria sp. Soil773]